MTASRMAFYRFGCLYKGNVPAGRAPGHSIIPSELRADTKGRRAETNRADSTSLNRLDHAPHMVTSRHPIRRGDEGEYEVHGEWRS